MTGIIRPNPSLRRRLEAILGGNDANALLTLLATLSNSERRTAGWLLGEELLPRLATSETFMFWFDALTAADVLPARDSLATSSTSTTHGGTVSPLGPRP